MKNKMTRILGLAAIAVVFTMCKPQNTEQETVTKQDAPTVKVELVKKSDVMQSVSFAGTLIAGKENHLAPATAARIEKINVEVGDRVATGQVVVVMDNTQLQQAKINYESLANDLKRLDTLVAIGSATKQSYDQLKARYDVAKSNYEFLAENIQLKAPISGIITGKYYNDGEMFGMTPNPATGKAAIVSIMQINPLKTIISVPESYYPYVSVGQETMIVSELYPNDSFPGKVTIRYPIIDNMSKTFKVEIKIQNTGEKLRPGMFVKAVMNFGIKNTVVIPAISLLKQTGTNDRYVFVNNNGKARKVPVEIGEVFDDKIEILKGLKIGDQLLVAGQNKVEDGVEIQIVK